MKKFIKLLILPVIAFFLLPNTVSADHIWGARNLVVLEDPDNPGTFKIEYEFYRRNGWTSNWFSYELYVVEEGCSPSDGFTAEFFGCTDTRSGLELQWNPGTLATGILLCPGKTYNAVLYTRRRGNEGGPPCGSNEDRAGAASPLGELIKFPAVGPNDPANIWDGAPADPLGDAPSFDGNWAYLINSLVVPGDRKFQIEASFDVEDCFGGLDQTINYTEADGNIINTELTTVQVRCGSELVVTYDSDNTCGVGFAGNTFQIDNTSTISGFDPSSGNVNTAMGSGLNVDGRFEILSNAMALGNTCSTGLAAFEFKDADCNAETDVQVNVEFNVEVFYPTSNFADPIEINCDMLCGQELILPSNLSNPQWQPNGLNAGNSTTLSPIDPPPGMSFNWSGQICTPAITQDFCNEGSGSVTVDQCATCGVYDITYEIANSNCTECSTTTTKQVTIVTPVITNVMATETTSCGDFIPELSYQVEKCNPSDGSASGVAFNDMAGSYSKFWTRNDMPGVLIPDGSTMLEVLEGTSVTFTPTFVNSSGCSTCDAVGTPITITSFSPASDPTNGNTTVDICEGNAISLMAVCSACADASAPTVEWFSNATGGTSISTGASFNPTSGSSVAQQGVFDNMSPGLYTFFAECVCNGCPSNRIPYSISVVEEPFTPTATTIDFTCTTSTTGLVPLTTLFAGADMTPENFTSNGANPSNIQGGALIYDGPGCFCVDYNLDNGTCPAVGPITSCVIISEDPQPSFNIQNPVCYSAAGPAPTATPILTSPTYSAPVDRVWSASGPGTIDPVTGTVTFSGVGTFMVTLTETVDYSACGDIPAGSCTNSVTQSISVESGDNLDPSFSLSNNEPCLNEAITLTPVENGGVFSGTNVVDNGDGTGGVFTPTSCGVTDITYTRFSMNGCENVLTISVSTDETAPVLNVPANLTVECDGTGNSADIMAFEAMFSAMDNCNIASSNLSELSNINTCGNTSVITYQYTVTDECNNTSIDYATITIEDSEPPIITPANTDPTIVDCDGNGNSADIQAWLNSNGGLTNADVSEMCGTFEFEFSFTGVSVEDPMCIDNIQETYTAVFTAVDQCGNESAPVTRELQIRDNTNPSLVVPASITLECNADNNDAILQNFLTSAFSIDGCDGDVTITNDFTALPDCGDILTVTFTAIDDCNNMMTATSLISIEDTRAPIVTLAPTDLVLECDGTADPGGAIANWLAINGNGIFEDLCDPNPVVTAMAGTTTTLCPGSTITPYTFTVTDECGNNSVNEVANVIIQDNTPPVLVVAADPGPIACQGANPFLWAGAMAATANDACSNVTVTNTLVSVVEDGCAGNSTYTFSFTATDECGNSISSPGTYTTTDNTGPSFTVLPEDITVACGDNITGLINTFLNVPTAEDGCGGPITLTNDYDGTAPDLCGDNITVTFTATDECGNSTITTGEIVVEPETTLPTFDNCPADMSVNVDGTACSTATVFFPTPTSDDCNIPVTIVQSAGPSSGSEFPIGTTGVTFLASDACNNTVSCTFNITVVDDTAPNITCPNDIVICNDDGECTWAATSAVNPLFTDGCSTSTTYEVTTPSGISSGMGSAAGEILEVGMNTIEYTVDDGNGNMASCMFTVIVEDCEDPIIECPEHLVLECQEDDEEAEIMAWLASISGTDNCDIDLDFTSMVLFEIAECGQTYTRQYQFTAADDAGNSSICFANVVVEDNIAPILADNAPDVTFECDGNGNGADLSTWLANNSGILPSDVTEQCGPASDFINNYNVGNFVPDASCPSTGYYDVEYTAKDQCDNISNPITVRFTIVDTTVPTITPPSDITLSCNEESNDLSIIQWLSLAHADDICSDNINISNDYTTANLPGCESGMNMLTVTFTATDDCGQTAMASSTITIVDNDKPIIMTPPADLILECPATMADILTWTDAFGGMTAIDQCDDDVTLSFTVGTPTGTCGSNEVTPYTFTATDDCGNSISEIAYLITTDTTDPILTLPTPGMSTDCAADPLTLINPWLASASATDDCDNAPNITAALISQNSECAGTDTEITYTYVFTASDACGNQSIGTSTFSITDTEAPMITPPSDLSLECGDDISLNVLDWLDNYSVIEACQITDVSNSFDASAVDLCGSTTPVTWTVIDDCGAMGTATANIIIQADSEAPLFLNCPTQDIIVNVNTADCQARVNYPIPVATDCNEPVTVTPNAANISSGDLFPLGTSVISFTATDNCGNTSTCTFNIIVEDNDTPTLSCPSDLTVCTDEGACSFSATSALDPFFNENCTGATLTYTITGDATPMMSAATGFNTVSGDGVVFGLGASTITYTTTDASGNMATCTFILTVEDCQAPIITCPADISLECGDPGNEAAIIAFETAASATDNCDMSASISSDIFSIDTQCGMTSVTTYIFTATDDAGNTSTCSATITIEDTTDPIISNATSPTVECDGEGNNEALLGWLDSNGGSSVSTEECGSVLWSNNYSGLSNDCGSTGSATVTFTATDECGNTATTMGTFTIEDNTVPTIIAPSAITLLCGSTDNEAIINNWLDGFTAEDACGDVTVTNDYTTAPTMCEAGMNEVIVTWTVTDACEILTSTATSTITIIDNEKPIIMTPPVDLILECPSAQGLIDAWTASFGGMTAVDNCDDPVLSFSTGPALSGCGNNQTIPYTFTATDACGNSISEIAYLISEDNTDPSLIIPPAGNSNDCSSAESTLINPWLAMASATDNCDDNPLITHALVTIDETCMGTNTLLTYTYLFTVTDACGNQSTGTSTYTITDTEAPTITAPANLEVACGDDIGTMITAWLEDYSVTEACQDYTVTNNYMGSIPSLCGGMETVTWNVIDGCGAMSSATAMIIVADDNTPPTFASISNDLTVNVDVDNCESSVVFSTPVGADCNEPITITQVANTDGDLLSSGAEFPLGTTTVVFEAEDACGNTARDSFDITVVDSQLPSLSCLSNDVEKCNASGTCIWTADMSTDAIFADNCTGFDLSYEISGATTAMGDSLPRLDGVMFELGTSTVTYTLIDPAGNEVTCSFDVVVNDCEAPTVTCPPSGDLILECSDMGNTAAISAWLATATFDDNCPDPTITNMISNVDHMCGMTSTTTYLFTATDAAGNTATCTAQVIIQDTSDPTIDIMAMPMTVECDGQGNNSELISWLNSNGGAAASDLCGTVTWSNNFTTLSDACGDTGSATVIFTATDECGLTANTTATFTIEDTTNPTIIAPEAIIIECGNQNNEAIVQNWLNGYTTADICGLETVTNDYDALPTDCTTGNDEVSVTWTVTDACGTLNATASSTITLVDNQSPVIMIPPTDLIVECTAPDRAALLSTWEAAFGNGSAADNCDADVLLTFTAGTPTDQCGMTSTTQYTFVASDDCGNTITTFANYIVIDETAPNLTLPTATNTVECDGSVETIRTTWLESASGIDDCGGDVSITYNTPTISTTCTGTVTTITETYTFTATDECGNDSINTAVFIIEDNTAPTIIHNTGNLIVACGDNKAAAIIPWLNDVTVTEGCQETTITNDYNGSVPNLCGGNLTVTWTVIDECMAMSTTSAMIIVENDMTPPTFTNISQDLTINVDVDNCESNVVFSTPVGADCNEAVIVTQVANADGGLLTSGAEFPVGTTTVVFEAEDACGNTARDSFDITVVDTQEPSLSCPSNDVIKCNDTGQCYWTANMSTDAIFADNCGGFDLSYSITGATTAMGDSLPRLDAIEFMLGTSLVTYTLVDTMGNTTTCTFNVIVEDCEEPTVTCPPAGNLTLECADTGNDAAIAAWISTAMFADNCPDPTIVNEVSFIENMCGNTETRTYTFTAIDAAGNTAVCTAEVIIEDTTAPMIDTPAAPMTVECDGEGNNSQLLTWLSNNGGAVASDLCGNITWSNNFTGLSNLCGASGTATVVFTATDECGLSSTTSAAFTIEDTTDPTITAPPAITLECGGELNEEIISSWLAQASGTDNCGTPTITNSGLGTIADACGMTGVYTVTFTSTDECGRTATTTSTVTIVDETAPTITIPAEDLILECVMDGDYAVAINAWTGMNGGAEATDGCSEPLTWSFSAGTPIDECGNTTTTIYTFVVEDECMNRESVTASVIITDLTPPELTEPTDITVQCEDAAATTVAAWIATASATDICSTPTVTNELWNTISGCGNTTATTYLFTATDECGNIDTAFATYTIADETAPTIMAPADLLITCGDDDIATQINQWLGESITEDGCGSTNVTTDYNGDLPDACGGTFLITFTVTDDCGNMETATSNIIYTDDTTPPTLFNCQSDITVNTDASACGTQIIYSTPFATDCNGAIVTPAATNIASGGEFPLGDTEIKFYAQDNCGNIDSCMWTITVEDNDAPVLICPENITVCNDTNTCDWNSSGAITPITSAENCPGITISYSITNPDASVTSSADLSDTDGDASGYTFELGLSSVTYTISDDQGNSSSCSFNILVEDCESPLISCPSDTIAQCSSTMNAMDLSDFLARISAVDNCDSDITITNLIFNTTSGCGNTETITYQFTATDDAGNTSVCFADFELTDTTIPVINNVPADMTVECDGNGNNAQLLSWLQNNGGLTDADVTEDCGSITWSNNFDSVSFTENTTCADDIGFYEVQFVATDECGNPSIPVALQFVIEDTTDPILSVPNPITLECSDPDNAITITEWLASAFANDLCSDVTVTNDDPGVFVGACANTGVTTYTFTATDDCGNTATATSIVTIEDNTPPTITIPAMDMTVECGPNNGADLATWLSNNAGSMATDECSATADLTFSNEMRTNIAGCENTSSMTYAFIVTDECGNSSESLATFTIEDTTPPTIDNAPENETVECDGAGNNAQLTTWLITNGNTGAATDICGTVIWSYELIDFTDSCGTNGTKTYTFTASDECGNTSTSNATFTIEDTTPPSITTQAIAFTAECNGSSNSADLLGWLNSNGGAEASDICSGVVWTNDYSTIDSNCGADGVDVTFTATDNCGNTSTTIATFTIDDTDNPVWEIAPQDLTLECTDTDIMGQIDTWLAINAGGEAEDGCSLVTYSNDFTALSDGCGLTGSALVTFTATDGCNNATTATATITVVDNTPPSLVTEPTAETVECDGAGNTTDLANWLVNYAGITYTDGCSASINIDSVLIGTEELCGGTLIYTYAFFATDECDNVSTQTMSTFTIEDTTDPTITPVPMDMIVECDGAGNTVALQTWLDDNAGADATDNCSQTFTWEYDLVTATDSCGTTGSQTYRFTVADDCGNTSTAEATLLIEDTTPPTIDTQPTDFTAECNGADNSAEILGWLNTNGGAQASDMCGNVTWTNNYGAIDSDCGADGVQVTFIATDDCGNASTVTATFTIDDTAAPIWEILPQDLTLECDGSSDPLNEIDAWLDGVGGGEAEDSCSLVVYTNDFTMLSDGCGSTGTLTVTFTATDACGNSTDASADVTIVDNTGPMITSPALDETVECDGTGNNTELTAWLAMNGGASVADICSDTTWNTPLLLETIENCGDTQELIYAFSAQDACGNQSDTAIASFIIIDTTSPTIDTEAIDNIVECNGTGNTMDLQTWLDSNGGATASDICGTTTWEYDLIQESDLCDLTGGGTYRFTVTDACGNTSTTEATFEIEDTEAPIIQDQAIDIDVVCDGDNNITQLLNWLNNNGGATATDNCNEVIWTNDYGQVNPGACQGTGSITVTFTATDGCGNATSTTATINISDDVAPYWTINPQDVTFECNDSDDPLMQIETWLGTVGFGEAADSCSVVAYSNDFTMLTPSCGAGSNAGSALVTFTATDACGNSTERTAMVTVVDNTKPSVTNPASDMTVECDGAGNLAELQAWLDDDAGASWEDECGTTTRNTPELLTTIEGCGLTNEMRYAFTATDACGNVSDTIIGIFIIEDTTSPTIDPEAMNMVVECDGDGNDSDLQAWLDSMASSAATDACSDESLNVEWDLITEEDSCGITGIQVYRFTFTDNCGNATSTEGTFTIEDTTPPVIVGGENYSGECDQSNANNDDELLSWLNNRGGATASDMCGTLVWSNDYNVDNFMDGCNDSRNIDVTFTATDECGNASSITLNFSTGDNTPPVFTNCPRPPVIVDAPEGWCNSFVNFSLPLATDNCGIPFVEQTDDTGLSTGDLFPVGLTLLEFTATDSCGNSTTCELKIIVNDFHTPPSIECPVDQTVNNDPAMCGATVDGIEPFDIEDNCPDNLAVVYTITDEDGNIIEGGVEDASGFKFPTGTNTVTYEVIDQPILLITEIMNDGNNVGIEISNFGPGSIDISCLDIAREGIQDTIFNVPNGTVVGVGEVYTVFLDGIDPNQGAGYTIGLLDNILDGVAINAYAPTGWTFDGDIAGSNIFRNRFPDTDSSDDWSIGNSCAGLSFGEFNPELPMFTDNGSTSSLQSEPANTSSCSFTIIVQDNEAPYCAGLETSDYPSTDTPITFTDGGCATSIINVSDVFNVSDVNIIDLEGEYPNMSEVTITLTSPEGTVVTLFDGLCAGSEDWDINLDDQAANSQASITCAPLGNGESFQPLQAMDIFNGEAAFGDWQLDVFATGNDDGTLTTWTLQLSELAPYSQTDTVLVNDTLLCGATFEWQHPFIGDNCEAGDISVEYVFLNDNAVILNTPINIEAGASASEFFAVGTTQVIYTLTDGAGNTSQCGFDVTVIDTEDPDLSGIFDATGLCQDITIQLDAGECSMGLPGYGAGFPLAPIGSNDNCGIDSVSYDPPVGFQFPIGVTPVTITVYDAAGNSTSCTFNVTVNEFDNDGNNTLACNNNINLSLGPDCTATVNADMILEGDQYGCYDNYCIVATTESGIVVDNIFDLTDVGQTFIITITDCEGSGNSCWGYVTIEQKLIPEIECAPDTIISCNMATNPEFTGYPTVLSCEQDVQMTYFDDYEDFGPCGEPRARITREWTVTDESGNVVNCTQTIDIEQFDTEDIEFPADYTIATGLDCALVANDPSQIHPDSTGYPTINGLDVPLSTNGLCMVSWNWDDQILFSCEGSYEILRKWFIRDMCEEVQIGINPIEHYQIIKILDTEGPTIHDCPNDVTISTDPWSCTGTYELADIISTIDDNCGGVDQVQVSVNGGTVVDNMDGTFTITNMEKGDHLVRVRARDYCYNYSTCEFNINVFDGTAPVVTCTQFINVSLTTEGKAKMFVESVDAGSYDNCTEIRRELFRMDDNCGIPENTLPGQFVEFCCADVEASPIMVALQVWDDANMDGVIGNEGDNVSLCMVEVTVEDKLPPAITCPADLTLECNADVEDLAVTGEPTIEGACSNNTATYQDFRTDLNNCGAAIINRRWTVDGRPDVFCTQVITLETGEPFNGNIQWPADWEGACLDNIPQNEPIFVDGACDQVAYSVATDTFDFVEDVCYKLIKEWTVIDWCQYEPNNPNTGGIWMHTQIVKISDDTAPEIQQCADITIDLNAENCMQDVVVTNTAMDSVCGINSPIKWAYQLDLDADGNWDIELDYNDNTPNDILVGDEASIMIKDATPGNYKIAWKAFDGCGNVGSCQYDIVIRDGKAPTPYCIDVATALMQDVGTISIWANDFNLSSFDNCTAQSDLLYSFSGDVYEPSMEFSCNDIPNGISETIELEMWVWDEAGNKDFCIVQLDLQDNLDQCQDTLSNLAIISGRVATEEEEPVNGVDITLTSFAPEYPYTNTSNEEGEFYFLYNPTGYDFEATAERNTDYREGVSTLDLVMVQRHILGLQDLDSPYKIIAGDVNNDERLTASDLLSMRKLILGVTNTWENKSWRFVNQVYEFPNAEDPFPYEEEVQVLDLMESIDDADMIAVKIGDVNGSASSSFNNAKAGIAPRSNPIQKMILEKVDIDGKIYIEFRAAENGKLYGFQFGAENTGFDIKGLERGLIDVSADIIAKSNHKVRMSWSDKHGVPVFKDQVLFRMLVESANELATLSIDENDLVPAEIYMNTLEIKNLEFEWRNDASTNSETAFRLDQNEPNPFIDVTEIGFFMPEAGEATFSVFDIDGKLILRQTSMYEAGENVINVSSRDIGVKGMVVYEVSGDGFSGSRKMIVVE
jgi:subtilisin-like proprotein convertase family protein